MRIGVFAYNFPHWKTQQGLFNLLMHGFRPDAVFAAEWKKLNVPHSAMRIVPKDRYLTHPKIIAERFGLNYIVCDHDDALLISREQCDVGVILGARILTPDVIGTFRVGVINMHPGWLPDNRGLDNVKWAVAKDMPMGVTAHFIDGNVDRGRLICREEVNIYADDTLMDLQLRVQEKEQELMINAMRGVIHGFSSGMLLGKGTYHGAMPPEVERELPAALESYRKERAIDGADGQC